LTHGPAMFQCGSVNDWCCNIDNQCCDREIFSLPQAEAETTIQFTLSYPSGRSKITTFEASKAEATVRLSLSYPSGPNPISQATNSSAEPSISSFTTDTPATQTQRPTAVTSIARTSSAVAEFAHKKASNDIALKAGAGVGIPLGIAVVCAMAYVIYLQWKPFQSKFNDPARTNRGEGEIDHPSPQLFRAPEVGYQPSELPAVRERVELSDRGTSQLHNDPAE
ncbi:MAG: hypothetical protein Q9191_007119, partial [Dirinaria sp. TL-2023a]